jgi:hypothetical protein
MCGGSRARRAYTTTEEVVLEDQTQPARYANTYGTAAYEGRDLVYANGAYGRNGAVVSYSPRAYANGLCGNGMYRHRHRRGNYIAGTGHEHMHHSGRRYDPNGGVSRLPSNLVSLIYMLFPLPTPLVPHWPPNPPDG